MDKRQDSFWLLASPYPPCFYPHLSNTNFYIHKFKESTVPDYTHPQFHNPSGLTRLEFVIHACLQYNSLAPLSFWLISPCENIHPSGLTFFCPPMMALQPVHAQINHTLNWLLSFNNNHKMSLLTLIPFILNTLTVMIFLSHSQFFFDERQDFFLLLGVSVLTFDLKKPTQAFLILVIMKTHRSESIHLTKYCASPCLLSFYSPCSRTKIEKPKKKMECGKHTLVYPQFQKLSFIKHPKMFRFRG